MSGTGPEQAATVTPGQAAYEAWCKTFRSDAPWSDIGDQERRAWEAVEAAIERKPGSERVAELVTEGNELRERLALLESGTVVTWNKCAACEAFAEGVRQLSVSLGTACAALRSIALGTVRDPSAAADMALAAIREQGDTPAAVTAGTEHLAGEISRLAIGGEDQP